MEQNPNNKPLPRANKGIKSFLSSEDGKISKKGLVAGAAIMAVVGMAAEAYGHSSHNNGYFQNPAGGPGNHTSHSSHGSHASHASHGSHGSHGSHASHGSHGSHGSW